MGQIRSHLKNAGPAGSIQSCRRATPPTLAGLRRRRSSRFSTRMSAPGRRCHSAPASSYLPALHLNVRRMRGARAEISSPWCRVRRRRLPAIGRTRPEGGLPRHRGIMGAGPRRSVRARRRCVRSARRFRSSLPPQRSAHPPVGCPETGVQMKRPWRCLCSGGAIISVQRNHKHR